MKQRIVNSSSFLFLLAILCLVSGSYLLATATSPYFVHRSVDAAKIPVDQTDRLIIPQIGVNELVKAGNASVLELGVWHRYPERGDPTMGGNFVMAAHRFNLGRTPGQTARKSPFYHIDKLMLNDRFYVDWHGKRYAYTVTRRYSVKPGDIGIEAPSKIAKMTLYTCSLAGSSDGRVVVEASPVNP